MGETMKDTGRTGSVKAFTGKHETASMTARQPSVTARQRAVELKKKRTQKRTLYIVFTALAAATIIVIAFILKGAAEQRSYNNYYSIALQSYYSGDYDSALANLRRASAISQTEECAMLMVDCYEKQGNYAKALEYLEEMYKQDKNNGVVLARIAAVKDKISAEKSESLITVAGKQYDSGTSTLSIRNTALGDGILGDVVKLYSLSSLTLSGNNLSNISPLSTLGGLTFLDLSDNSISDLMPLTVLHELKTLYLDNNPIRDFSPIYSMQQLEMLSIRGIGITSEQLKELSAALPNCAIHSETAVETVSEVTIGRASFRTDAEELDLSNMGISDLSALSACKTLKRLNITGNSVSDLTPLMDLPELEWVCLNYNLITDLRPLMGLSALRYISAEGNGIANTAPLAPLINLNELYLAFNPVSDFSGIKKLPSLRKLGLESTGLTDEKLQELSGLSGLDLLRIHDNPDLSGEAVDALKAQLRGCTIQHSDLLYSIEIAGDSYKENVKELSLFGRGITDIQPLIKFKKLEVLDLGSNEIENIYAFEFFRCPLRELRIANNRITDSSSLVYLSSLETLDISGNSISSITAIKQLPNLRRLNVSGNPLSQEQVDELRDALPDCEIIFNQ